MKIVIDFGSYSSTFEVCEGQIICTTESPDDPELTEESDLSELGHALNLALITAAELVASRRQQPATV